MTLIQKISSETCCCRIELSRTSGSLLRQFSLDECKGAPHEFRGVLRSSLLRTLEKSLHTDTVRYSSPIQEVIETSKGNFSLT